MKTDVNKGYTSVTLMSESEKRQFRGLWDGLKLDRYFIKIYKPKTKNVQHYGKYIIYTK